MSNPICFMPQAQPPQGSQLKVSIVEVSHTARRDKEIENYIHRILIDNVVNVQEGFHRNKFELTNENPVLIAAPTGMGKTHYVIDILIPHILKNRPGKNILLASNRLAISVQQKRTIMKITRDKDVGDYTDEGMRKLSDLGGGRIKIMTLQAMETLIRDASKKDVNTADEKKRVEGLNAWCQDLELVVIDEAHYFTSDCLFNCGAPWLLNKIPSVFAHANRLYLTATPGDVLTPLAEAEWAAIQERITLERIAAATSNNTIRNPLECAKLTFYDFPRNVNKHISVRYFRKIETIIKEIQENTTKTKDSWLIFTTSMKKGEELSIKLGKRALFLSAENKRSDEFNKLVVTERLPSQIVIATKVLDCGVNISDDTLKHIVILEEDYTTFIQELGRKRCKNNERITLYVKAVGAKRFQKLRKENAELLKKLNTVKNGTSDEKKRLFAELWHSGTAPEKALFHTPYGGALAVKPLVEYVLYKREDFYNELKKQMAAHGEAAFPHMVLQWLGLTETYREENWLEYDELQENKTKLEEFFLNYCNFSLETKEAQVSFAKQLVELYSKITGKNRRGDREYQVRALNNCLFELKAPYKISAEKGNFNEVMIWRLDQKSHVETTSTDSTADFDNE